MAPADSVSKAEDQLKFAMECLKNCNGPVKVDFDKVALVLETSKGAAAKRWERLCKTFGTTPSTLGANSAGAGAANGSATLPSSPISTSKKRARKAEQLVKTEPLSESASIFDNAEPDGKKPLAKKHKA